MQLTFEGSPAVVHAQVMELIDVFSGNAKPAEVRPRGLNEVAPMPGWMEKALLRSTQEMDEPDAPEALQEEETPAEEPTFEAKPEEVKASVPPPLTPPKRGRGRPPAKAAAPKPEPAVEAAPVPDPEPPVIAAPEPAPAPVKAKSSITMPLTDAMAALQAVNSKAGLPAAREVLKAFNCTRISELPQKEHPAFIKACTAKLGA